MKKTRWLSCASDFARKQEKEITINKILIALFFAVCVGYLLGLIINLK